MYLLASIDWKYLKKREYLLRTMKNQTFFLSGGGRFFSSAINDRVFVRSGVNGCEEERLWSWLTLFPKRINWLVIFFGFDKITSYNDSFTQKYYWAVKILIDRTGFLGSFKENNYQIGKVWELEEDRVDWGLAHRDPCPHNGRYVGGAQAQLFFVSHTKV